APVALEPAFVSGDDRRIIVDDQHGLLRPTHDDPASQRTAGPRPSSTGILPYGVTPIAPTMSAVPLPLENFPRSVTLPSDAICTRRTPRFSPTSTIPVSAPASMRTAPPGSSGALPIYVTSPRIVLPSSTNIALPKPLTTSVTSENGDATSASGSIT